MLKNNTLKSQDGFTLMELIISMAIIGVLTVIIYNGLRLGIRARESGEDFEENNQRLRTIYSMISSQIKSARPYFYPGKEDPKKLKLAFVGKPDSIQFVTSAPRLTPGKKPEGIHEATIYLEEDMGVLESRGLLLRESAIRYPLIFESEEEPVVLAEDVTDLHFRYYFMLEGSKSDVAAEEGDGGDTLEERGIWTDNYDAEFLENMETSLREDGNEDAQEKPLKSSTRLPIAVEVSFSISRAPRKNKNIENSLDEEKSLNKLVFPPTIIFINSGLKGSPIYEPLPETEDQPTEK
jgi:prepilin-type N-terminal cleavage/methylation domain-containing protein